jgi:ribosomal protein S18 acetylase RimI-like enzyme
LPQGIITVHITFPAGLHLAFYTSVMPAFAPAVEAAPALTSASHHDLPSVVMRFDLPRPGVVIRALQQEDNLKLEWQGGADLRNFYQRQWMAHEIGEAFVLIADFNGFPIGQAAIYWEGKPAHPGIPDLQSLRVHPIFQGQGIGTQLLEAGALVVKQRGFSQIGLSVNPDNLRAHHLYERCGYRVMCAPYQDHWQYTDATGQTIVVSEIILDMVKEL